VLLTRLCLERAKDKTLFYRTRAPLLSLVLVLFQLVLRQGTIQTELLLRILKLLLVPLGILQGGGTCHTLPLAHKT